MTYTQMVEMSKMKSTSRGILVEDDLSDILETFKQGRGVHTPLLLLPDLTVVDGERRLEAARRDGYDGPLPAKVFDEFEEAVDYIVETGAGSSQFRLVELYLDLDPLAVAYEARARREGVEARMQQKRATAKGGPGTLRGTAPWLGRRKLFIAKTGMSVNSLNEAMQFIHMRSMLADERDHELYIEARSGVMTGAWGFISARNMLLRKGSMELGRAFMERHPAKWSTPLVSTVPEAELRVSVKEQLKMLENGINGLEGIMAGLRGLDHLRLLPQDEVVAVIGRYVAVRKELNKTVHSLKLMEMERQRNAFNK